ncbi:MAG: YkgJ family cysteine cluster protein [Myxococcales bacterium]|nr:YkgJ family cysteine cluster protein [Myxococcales bacterium]
MLGSTTRAVGPGPLPKATRRRDHCATRTLREARAARQDVFPAARICTPDSLRRDRLRLPSKAIDEFDCRQCGACCRDAADGRVLVGANDLLRWRREQRADISEALVPGHFGQRAFAAAAGGACIHLGLAHHPHDCAIYPTRAQSCRDVEPGDRGCLQYRRLEP